jgi:ribosomal protein L37AE/L43A
MPKDAIIEQVESNLACPNCKEKNHLDRSSFDIGDTECYRCGAVFLSTIIGKDSIVSWNEDTKRAHEELIAEAMKGV